MMSHVIMILLLVKNILKKLAQILLMMNEWRIWWMVLMRTTCGSSTYVRTRESQPKFDKDAVNTAEI